ncbi:MAG: hypothetical protein U0271_07920 [Polyangiaceae bacterium]
MIGTFLGLASVLVAVVAILSRLARTRAIEPEVKYLVDRHATKVKDAKGGAVVRIVGRAEPLDASITSPITGRVCVAWEVVVWDLEDLMRRPILTVSKQCPFGLRDGTGLARIEGDARMRLDADHQGERLTDSGRGLTFLVESCPPEVDQLLEAHGLSSVKEGVLLNTARSLRWTEGVLAVGELGTAVGQARWSDGDATSYRDHEAVLSLVPGIEPVTVTDDRALVLRDYGPR